MEDKKNVGGFIPEENTQKKKNVRKDKDDDNKAKKSKKKSNKKPGFFAKIGRWFKETFTELKKVSWPTFAKVLKQTGVVIVVVLIFLVVITGFDTGLYSLLRLIKPNLPPLF